MNFNANAGSRPPGPRKVKRVSDVNAMGYSYSAYNQSPAPNQFVPAPTVSPQMNAPYAPPNEYVPQNFEQQAYPATPKPTGTYGFNPNVPYSNVPTGPQAPIGNVFGQPIVQDMAYQYGQQLANTGKAMVKQEIDKFVPMSKLKYYFAVDTRYVMTKLRLLFFPFTHKDWSIKYEQDSPIQPRFEINAPDLYIPMMGYITYVLVAGIVLGTQQRFSPEQIGILASSALAWCIVELALYSSCLYISNIQTSLRTLDILAYGGYKFVGIITSILLSLLGGKVAYYAALVYCSLALAFYLVRALKIQTMQEPNQTSYYGDVPASGHKRRLYFLLFVAVMQPLLSWWLSFHLVGPAPVAGSI